ncbi:hypothetical protein DPMN_160786 [Dreissena polymorpha]|uniref:Uncharacterized protein n=1 Tax=Dreissena polymorpha TaxID=45954 RepID=A0A9D4ERU1_DREPO|nr:hypothetical protein DPMN_160786 [Dreissena polymorpha]
MTNKRKQNKDCRPCRISQSPIYYRPKAGFQKPPVRRGLSTANVGLARRVPHGVRAPRLRQTFPWVPSKTVRRSGLARTVVRLGQRDHPCHKRIPTRAASPALRAKKPSLRNEARETTTSGPIYIIFIYIFPN